MFNRIQCGLLASAVLCSGACWTTSAIGDVEINMPPPPPPQQQQVVESTDADTDAAADADGASTEVVSAADALAANPDLLGQVAMARFSNYRSRTRNVTYPSAQRSSYPVYRNYVGTSYRSYWGYGPGYGHIGWGFFPYGHVTIKNNCGCPDTGGSGSDG